jgi:hypothetical protein
MDWISGHMKISGLLTSTPFFGSGQILWHAFVISCETAIWQKAE